MWSSYDSNQGSQRTSAASSNPTGPKPPGSNAAGSKAPALGMAEQLVFCLTSWRDVQGTLLKKQIREAVLCKVHSTHATTQREDTHVIMYIACKTVTAIISNTLKEIDPSKASKRSKSGHHCLHCDCSMFKLLLCLEGIMV